MKFIVYKKVINPSYQQNHDWWWVIELEGGQSAWYKGRDYYNNGINYNKYAYKQYQEKRVWLDKFQNKHKNDG